MKAIAIIGSIFLSLVVFYFVPIFFDSETDPGVIPFTNLILISGWGALIYTELRTLRKQLLPPTKTKEDNNVDESCESEKNIEE